MDDEPSEHEVADPRARHGMCDVSVRRPVSHGVDERANARVALPEQVQQLRHEHARPAGRQPEIQGLFVVLRPSNI